MKLLAPEGAEVRACDVDGAGFEAALARSLQQLRAHSKAELRSLTGDPGLADLADGTGTVSRSRVVDGGLVACLEALDQALSFAVSDRNVEVFSQGELVSADLVLEAGAREHSPRLIDPGRFSGALAGGYTIRVNGIDRLAPPIGELCRLLELVAGTAANTNAYLTGAEVPGVRAHVDSHDVAMIQLVGSKGWVCGVPATASPPGGGQDSPISTPGWTGKLDPGEVLTLPRGTAHEPHPDGSMSIHLSFGIRRPTAGDVVGQAIGSAPALFGDLGQVMLDDAAGESTRVLLEAIGPAVPAAALGAVLGRYRHRQPVRRTISVATHQHALQQPSDYELRWSAPGGVVVPADAHPPGTVGVASQFLDLDDGDFDPFLRLLAGERVGVDGWARAGLGEESFRCLAGSGICEPIPRES